MYYYYLILPIFAITVSLHIYFMLRISKVTKFLRNVIQLVYEYNLKQINLFYEIQREAIREGLPLMDENAIKELDFQKLFPSYNKVLYSFKPLTLENWLSKEVVEELNKFK